MNQLAMVVLVIRHTNAPVDKFVLKMNIKTKKGWTLAKLAQVGNTVCRVKTYVFLIRRPAPLE